MTAISPFIHQHFDGQIWKFVIDDASRLLFAEIRNPDQHEVSFASIDLNSGKLNFNNLTLTEKWLSGLDGSFNGTMFLHGYQSAQSPAHKGITAIHGTTGQTLWSNYTYAISQISVNGPIAYNTQITPVKYFLLDAANGATLRPYNLLVDTALNPDIKFPDILSTIPPDFNTFFNEQITGNAHYIEHYSFRIVSLHTLKHGQLQQLLLVAQNGDLIYRDLLTDKIQKLQPESFIIHQNQLMYIKNTRELKIFNL